MKKKLSLKDLQVKSFVTSFQEEEKNNVKGGALNITSPLGGNCVSLLGFSGCNTCGIICYD